METKLLFLFLLSPMTLYQNLKKDGGDSVARKYLLRVLHREGGNVSAAARKMGCTRNTVRRAREGPLEDRDRTPHHQPRKLQKRFEEMIVRERKTTGYGRRRMRKHLVMKYGISLPESTVRNALRRNGGRRKKRRRKGESKPLYDYQALLPFEEIQIDTKYIEDYGALGKMVFNLRKYQLPRYQWTFICAKTKTRFLAYSYTLDSSFLLPWLGFMILWLRHHGITHDINLQADNGPEMCAGSKKKEERLNTILSGINASFASIPTRKKHLQGIVERSHRTDDEELYRPHLENITSFAAFMRKAQQWQDTYNCLRQSWGREMNGMTPREKLRGCGILNADAILHCPVLLLEDLLQMVKGGQYVLDVYQR